MPGESAITIRINHSNITGVGSIPNDALELIIDPIAREMFIPSVNSSDNFSIDLEFMAEYVDISGGSILVPVESIQIMSTFTGCIVTQLTKNTLRIIGNRSKQFSDSYRFVYPSGMTAIGDAFTTDFMALVEYDMPSIVSVVIDEQLKVIAPIDGPTSSTMEETDINLKQCAYWTTTQTEITIHNLVKHGTV